MTTSLLTLNHAQLARVCRHAYSPAIRHEDAWGSRAWWQKIGTEPVDIHVYAGEKVIDHSRHHWCTPMIKMADMSVWVLGAGVLSVFMDLLPFATVGLQAAMWLCAIGHNCWMSRHLMRWRADLVIVTNWRLIRTGGILSSGVKSYRFDTVGNCYRQRSIWGKLFGFCDLRIVQGGGIHNQGADDEYITRVPMRIARIIESRATQPHLAWDPYRAYGAAS